MVFPNAPGLDVFTLGGFQRYWDAVGGDIVVAICSFMHSRRMYTKRSQLYPYCAHSRGKCPTNEATQTH